MQLVINICGPDGELLDQLTITECTADKFGFVRATVAYALKRPDLKDKVTEYLRSFAD